MKSNPRVFIAPGDSYHAAISMFERAGFEVTKDYQEVDLVCFLGGTDVDPTVYGEERGPYTQSPDRQRDDIEVALFERFRLLPKVGICRGGQLLNVLNGGKMIQHLGTCVSGDVTGRLIDEFTIPEMEFRVDHHQGIIGAYDYYMPSAQHLVKGIGHVDYAGYYPMTKSIIYQPHPEWGHKGTEDYFFELIERYFGFARKQV